MALLRRRGCYTGGCTVVNDVTRECQLTLTAQRRTPLSAIGLRLCGMVCACLAVWGALSTPVLAQNFGTDSYITPFPKNDIYKIQLIGDSMAAGLQYALPAAFANTPRAQVAGKKLNMKRLTTSYFKQRLGRLRSSAYRGDINVAILMLGAWDRRNMRDQNGQRLRKSTGDWRVEYERRVTEVIKTLRAANVAVYWIGLPPFRRSDANRDVELINEIVRERAYLNGVKFLDAYVHFAGDKNPYAAYGPDQTGKIKLLREKDGIHLTYAGNKKLADFIERAVRRDLDAARGERSIPLDGDAQAQTALRERVEDLKRKRDEVGGNWLTRTLSGQSAAPEAADASVGFFGTGRGGEQKAETSRINLSTLSPTGREEIISVDIVRPAIPASVVALVTRKQREDKLTPMGDTLVDQISGGVNIMSSVTPANALVDGGLRRFSPAQTPFFRVLVKGERVQPRAGRADDVSWPRAQPKVRERIVRSAVPKQRSGTRRGGPIDFEKDAVSTGPPLPTTNPLRPRV